IRSVSKREGSFRQFQTPMIKKDGSVVRVETSGSPVYNTDGNIIGYRGTYTDITERTQMERALLESRNYNRFLFDDSPVPLVLIDADQMIYLDFNKAALNFYGYSSDELVGKKVGILSTPSGSESEKMLEHIQRCLNEGRDSYEARYQKPNTEIWYGLVSLVRFEHGEKNRILFSLQDPIRGVDTMCESPKGYPEER
ncbi:MAG: PAS domain-containing protein, partial [Methanospirillum sp.]|uniref:PAS domain-containing protein n=1 Tax=Methanospirillum sp. TaxID=45200 RepID=UPI00237035E4